MNQAKSPKIFKGKKKKFQTFPFVTKSLELLKIEILDLNL